MSKGYCQISLADLAPDAIDGCNRAALSELFGSQRVQPVLAFDRTAFHTEQPLLARGMSISGVQPKLSVTLDKQQRLIHTEKSGQFILKPSPEAFPHLAENEHATMLAVKQLLPAASAGLVRFAGDHREFVYLVRRFDRSADGQKIHQEQLDAAMGIKDKYGMEGGHPCVSYARAGQFIHQHLGFVATQSYYQMVVLAYLLCNNDLHLRNFGIIHKPKGSVLAPVYDFVNTVPYKAVFHSSYLALPLLLEEEGENGELAPGFDGPHGCYVGSDFIQFGQQIGLKAPVAVKLLKRILQKLPGMLAIYQRSFIPEADKANMVATIQGRGQKLAD